MTAGMTSSVVRKTDKDKRREFVSSLHRLQADLTGNNAYLAAQARQKLAKLRRSLAGERQKAEAYDLLFEYDPPLDEVDTWMLVAGLYGLHPVRRPDDSGRRTIGYAMGELAIRSAGARGRTSEAVKRRFTQLLSINHTGDALSHYLRQAVQLLRSKDVELDYLRLLEDLLKIRDVRSSNEEAQKVRLEWARDFYRVIRVADTHSQRENDAADSTDQKEDFSGAL